jgi:hypothetical protein
MRGKCTILEPELGVGVVVHGGNTNTWDYEHLVIRRRMRSSRSAWVHKETLPQNKRNWKFKSQSHQKIKETKSSNPRAIKNINKEKKLEVGAWLSGKSACLV